MLRAGHKMTVLLPLPTGTRASLHWHSLLGWRNEQRGNRPGPYLVRSLLPPGKGNIWLTAEVTTTQMGFRCPLAPYLRGTRRRVQGRYVTSSVGSEIRPQLLSCTKKDFRAKNSL